MSPNITRDTTSRIITISSITLVSLCIIIYSYITSYGLLQGPEILIYKPLQATNGYVYTVSPTQQTVITGIAKRVNSLTLNGKPIVIDQQGNFSQDILLFKGYNIEQIRAIDKFGNMTNVNIQLVYAES